MMYNHFGYGGYGPGLGMVGGLAWLSFLGPFFVLILLWSVFWKGLALWHAAGRGQPWWFVIMLVVNTAGILEIIYLFFVIKLKFEQLFSLHNRGHHS